MADPDDVDFVFVLFIQIDILCSVDMRMVLRVPSMRAGNTPEILRSYEIKYQMKFLTKNMINEVSE